MIFPNSVRWFESIRLEDVPAVGGKNASLGEMFREMASEGVRVPNGFALTVRAYYSAVKAPGVWTALHEQMDNLDPSNVELLAKRAAEARRIVYAATGSEAMRQTIAAAYRKLEAQYGANAAVAVRSSATAEDLPSASFAGQHESYLNISGADDLFEACRLCFASLFTGRAIVYRVNNGFDHFKVGLSVGVMKMVRSDRAASGVIFTLDTEFRLSRHRPHHGLLRPWRERRAGQSRSRRILRSQANVPRRFPERSAADPRSEAAHHDACQRPHGLDDPK